MVKRTINWLAFFIIAFLLIVAGLIMTLRFALPKISEYPAEISTYLSQKFNAQVNIGSIEALWVQSKPQFKINDIRIVDSDHEQRAVLVTTLAGELDIVQSIITFSPVFKQLSFDGFSLKAEQKNRQWLTVFTPEQDASEKKKSKQKNEGTTQLLTVLLSQSQVVFKNASLELSPEYRPKRIVGPLQFVMDNTTDMHQLSGSAELKYYGEHSSVEFALEAEQLAPNILDTSLKVYTKFHNISEQLLALNLWDIGVNIKDMSLDAKVWATLKNGLIYDVVGDASINSLHFEDPKLPVLVDSHMNFGLSTENDEHVIYLSNIHISDGENDLTIPAFNSVVSATLPRKIKQISVASVDLRSLSDKILKQKYIGEKLKKVLSTLKASGRVSNLVVDWSGKKISDFHLKADVENITVNNYAGAPALSGVTGLLGMSARDGRLDLDTQQLSLHFPHLFNDEWLYDSASGVVHWQLHRSEQGLESVSVDSQLLSVERGDMRSKGRFSINMPLDFTQQAELILMLSMQDNALKDVLHYVPPKLVGEPVNKWLNKAILAGQLDEAGFVLRTGIRKGLAEPINSSVQMYYKLAESKVNFDQNWPNLTADNLLVSYLDGELKVSSDQAAIASNQITQLSVTREISSNSLNIDAFISGDLAKLYTKIQTKPAKQQLPEVIRNWQLTGEHQSALALTIPLTSQPKNNGKTKDKSKAKKAKGDNHDQLFRLNLKTKLKNASLNDKNLQLSAKSIQGEFEFDSIKGLTSEKLSLVAFNSPAIFTANSKLNKKVLKTTIALKGTAAVKDVKPWLELPHMDKLTGSTGFDAKLDYCSSNVNCNQLLINTDLAGVKIDLPAPWGKSAKQKRKLQILKPAEQKQRAVWRYNYADIVRGVTLLANTNEKGVSARDGATSIALGGERPDVLTEPGVHVRGLLKGVDLAELTPYLSNDTNSEESAKAQSSADSQFKSLDLALADVIVQGEKLKRGHVNLINNNGHIEGQFNSELASGIISLPKNKQQSIELTLNRLNLETKGNGGEQAGDAKKWLINQNLQPANWPNVSLLIKRLNYNQYNIGQWSMQLSPTKKGYKASNIKGAFAGSNIEGEVAFTEGEKAVRTFMDLQVKGKNFGELLDQLGFSKVLESQTGELQSSLSWQGYPWGISQRNLNGRLSFEMTKGRIIEAGTSANFLRIFGILNLNTVIKRLKLDFSDLLESGVTFDKVTASYYLQDGVASSQEPLKLQGDSASVEMAGTIDLAGESLEQSMLVAIPLSSNAPLAALLLATPQVAGIAFVVDKLLGKRLAKLTALRYKISGPWANPKVSPVIAGSRSK